MNKGLKMATGDIVGILNSDDFYTNEKVLEKVSKALDNKIIDAVYGDIHFECLLRFIFVHKIRTTYIPMDFVTMRTGGASTSGFTSHKQIISDHQKAFKRNGIYSNIFLESLRYIYKIHEILLTKTTKGNKTR